MKPITTAEVRAKIAKFPPELQADANLIAFSVYDDGTTAGLANQARALNPYLASVVPASPVKSKGKAR